LEGYSIGEVVKKKIYKRDFDRSYFIPVSVPGTVRQALLESGKIPDPYYGYNSEESWWVEGNEWWFCTDFELSSALKGRFRELYFKGINFKDEVRLNGQKIGKLNGLENPYILSSIQSEDRTSLDISCKVRNLSDSPKDLTLEGVIKGKDFDTENVEINRTINFSANEYKTVKIEVYV